MNIETDAVFDSDTANMKVQREYNNKTIETLDDNSLTFFVVEIISWMINRK